MSPPVRAYVGLGANLGDAAATLRAAATALDRLPETRVARLSRLYRTPAWGGIAQPDFVNAAAALDTGLGAHALMRGLLDIEQQAGRVRARDPAERWGPRVLDLDLLLYGSAIIDSPTLQVPHPRLHERAFVLVPLAELDPAVLVPGRGAAREWLERMETSDIQALG